MDIDEIRTALAFALEMRPPKYEDGNVPPSVKVREIEDYMLRSAWQHAELEEALHWLDRLVAHFKEKIEQMTGFEALLPAKARDRITQADTLTAKRKADPVTFEAGAEARQLRESILRQIARFEWEATVLSRAYTLISGG